MTIRVIEPPAPFLTPADIAGSHLPEDTQVARMIRAATEEIDGYTGWLGLCLAPQLLEWSLSRWPCRDYVLPIGPELEIASVNYVDPNGADQAWSFPTPLYLVDLPAVRGRRGDIRIRCWAGHGTRDPSDPTKWIERVPARVKEAVIMSVQHMKALSAENLFLRSEDVDGVGSRTYTVSDQAGAIIRDTSRRLLSGLKVPRI